MFKWFGKRSEVKKEKTKQSQEKESNFKWFGQPSGKKKRKMKQLWQKEFDIVKNGLREEQVVDFVNGLIAQQKASQQASAASLRSLIKTATTDAEQLAASIKMKAQAEAETETARIIAQAKQDAQEIRGRAEVATRKEAEDTLSVANRRAEITEVEAKQKALLFLLRAREEIEKDIREQYKRVYARLSASLQDLANEGQNIEMELKSERARLWESKTFELKKDETTLLKAAEELTAPLETAAPEQGVEPPVELHEEIIEEKIEQPTQLQEEVPIAKAAVSEPVEEVTVELPEQHLPEEELSEEEINPTQLEVVDSQTLYTGEVELVVAIPVDLKAVSKLYNYLQTIPDIKILRTRGSWDRGTTVTVVLDKPTPVVGIISKIPDLEVTAELLQKDSSVKRTRGSTRRGGKEVETKRIKLTLREAKPS